MPLATSFACAIPGIPVTDFSRIFFHHGPPLHVRAFEEVGLDMEQMGEILSVVSPLVLAPKVPKSGRYIFAAIADRLVPPEQTVLSKVKCPSARSMEKALTVPCLSCPTRSVSLAEYSRVPVAFTARQLGLVPIR